MFYDRYAALCQAHGVTPSRAAQEAGLSKSTVTKWKNDPDSLPTGNALNRLSRYFGVTVAELLDGSSLPPQPAPVSAPPKPAFTAGEPVPFYERFAALSRQKGVTPSRAAVEAGISKSIVSKWKSDSTSLPTGSIISQLTAYFGVSVGELMGEAAQPPEPRPVTDEDIKFALFGGSGDITDEMYQEVRAFAAFVRQRNSGRE